MLSFLNSLVFTLKSPWPLAVVFLFVALVAFVAFKKQSLDFSGACFAFLFGVAVFYILRFEGMFVFVLFYVSSTMISKLGRSSQHGTRSWTSVAANGFMAVLGAFIFAFTGSYSSLVMFAAAVAEANSDTWAGEIGRLSKKNAVSILSLKPVQKGISGGVTFLGFAGGFAGSLLIALSFALAFNAKPAEFVIVLVCGFSGCVFDSILGDSIQALYYDSVNKVYTEDSSFELVRGIKWVDNNMVNLLSNVFSSVLALGLLRLI